MALSEIDSQNFALMNATRVEWGKQPLKERDFWEYCGETEVWTQTRVNKILSELDFYYFTCATEHLG